MPLTVYPLPIPLNLLIKNRIFIPGQHFLLRRHLLLPHLHLLHRCALSRERRVNSSHDRVDVAQTFALAGFLVPRESPGDFPVGLGVRDIDWLVGVNGWMEASLDGEGRGMVWEMRTRGDHPIAGL
jgi:hypothetical protein